MSPWPRRFRRLLERLGLRRAPYFLSENPDYAGLDVGAYSYGAPLLLGCDGTPETHVSIGRYCSFAHGVQILLRANHPMKSATTYPLGRVFGQEQECDFSTSRGPVRIGHDVWVGYEALILSGVTIGNGAVIGARAVVTRDVPPYGIVAGNPARLVRRRFDDATVARLEATRWWDWPEERIRAHMHLLSHGAIEEFLAFAERESRPDAHTH